MVFTLAACSRNDSDNTIVTDDGITVRSITGMVSIMRGSETLNATSGMAFQEGDILRTTAGSTARLQLDASNSIEIGEQTEFRLENQNIGYAWRLESGVITVNIDKPMGSGKNLTVAVGNIEVLVRGTSYTLTILEQYEERLARLEEYNANLEYIIATLERVSSPANAELLAKFRQLHSQVQNTIRIMQNVIIMILEVHNGEVVILDVDGDEIEILTDGEEIIIGIDEEGLYDENIVILIPLPPPDILPTPMPSQSTPAPTPTLQPDDEITPDPYAPTDFPDGFHRYEYEGWAVYEGWWKNGLPNGEGKLMLTSPNGVTTYTGNFVDGLVHGMFTFEFITSVTTQRNNTWIFEVDMGRTSVTEVVSENGSMTLNPSETTYGVPPWGLIN